MNDRLAFEQALADLKKLDALAKQGDAYAQELKKAYDAGSPCVLGMPWPWERQNAVDCQAA